MTVLFVDAGNTRVKFGWRLSRDYRDAPCPREPGQVAFTYPTLAHELPAWLNTLPRAPRMALASNVAGPRIEQAIADLLAQAGCAVTWVRATEQRGGLVNGYREPMRLGADRWMGMLGIWGCARRVQAAPTAHLLAHFGTATTVDTIDESGRFVGGLILPGQHLMRQSLAAGTANLPVAEGDVTEFPDATHDAIASGIAAAQAGAVLRQWLTACERFGKPPRVHASGGAWPSIEHEARRLLGAAGSTQDVCVVDNPVLDGLACLAEIETELVAHRP
jgi:type III pantothenate kinase